MLPIRVTFDTNSYSSVVRPQLSKIVTTGWPLTPDRYLSKKRRIAWWYIRWCILRGRIRAAIPEGAFATEVLPNVDRINRILAVGTSKAANPLPITKGRGDLIQEAFALHFLVLHGARIAYGECVGVQANQWAKDDKFTIDERQRRFSNFIRHFNDFPKIPLIDLGENLSVSHGLAAQNPRKAHVATMNNISLDRLLWREGLAAEENSPCVFLTVGAMQKEVRALLSDWADFDIVAAHYAYGYDQLCTEDKGSPRSDSIFGAQYAVDLKSEFSIKIISIMDLAALCWRDFGFPVRTWPH